jgi:DNA-binding transcriptional LysR family regulator
LSKSHSIALAVEAAMQLKALRYFLMVASSGSFLAAARHFRVPASSVSRFIAALEKDLDQQLLYRSTRAVRLTEEGERFYQQVREALELLDHAAEQVGRKDTGLRGLLRVNAPEALGKLHIARLISELQDMHPGLTVELTLTDTYVDLVQEGVDIAVRVAPLIDSGLVGHVVGANRHIVAASPSYLAECGTPGTPADLLEHRCLIYKGQLGAQKWYFGNPERGKAEAFNVSGPLRSNSADVLLGAAKAGRGIVLFPTWLFGPDDFSSGRLVPLLTSWEPSVSVDPAFVQLLSPQSKLRSRKVREVSTFLLERIGTPPYWDAILPSAAS